MKYEVVYLPIADHDLTRISEALTDFPKKANRLFSEIEKKVRMLENTPFIWSEYPIKPEYRRMVLEDHLLFYKVDDYERKVKIYRILYSKMDILKYIK